MSKAARLRNALLMLINEHQRDDMLPTSARFLFYELVAREILSKHPTGKRRADQDMNDALTQLRKNGDVPWEWIADETRSLENFAGRATIKEWVLEISLVSARLDPWTGDMPLILTESRSLAGVLRDLCRDYRVMIAPTNGQCGGFLHTDIAPELSPGHPVLYLGDFELAGGDIEENTKRVLEQIVGELQWERLALTQQQVEFYDLPKIIKHDSRFKDGGAHEAVETEALSQRIIVEILRNRLAALLPEPLDRVLEREEAQRTAIRSILENI